MNQTRTEHWVRDGQGVHFEVDEWGFVEIQVEVLAAMLVQLGWGRVS